MSASLVGSEMCIRDSGTAALLCVAPSGAIRIKPFCRRINSPFAMEKPVSYRHLTLPTICSV
eukprot:4798090-Alexandrium_andersonii.AAC.1